MSDWSSSTTDMIVQIDDSPLMVRVSAIEAIRPTPSGFSSHSEILLSSGQVVTTPKLVEEVVATLQQALRRTTPTFGGKP